MEVFPAIISRLEVKVSWTQSMTSLQLQKLLFKLIFWLLVEIVLNLMGLDDIADYGEFVFPSETILLVQNEQVESRS